jgi:hypothetical protein
MPEDAISVSTPPLAQTIRRPLPFWLWAILLTSAAALMFAIYAGVVLGVTFGPCGSDSMGGIGYASGGGPGKTPPLAKTGPFGCGTFEATKRSARRSGATVGLAAS